MFIVRKIKELVHKQEQENRIREQLSNPFVRTLIKRRDILIYADTGTTGTEPLKREVSAFFKPQGLSVHFTNAAKIRAGILQTPTVRTLFMPGGYSDCFAASLGEAGNKAIRDFVSQGGFYYGICGGAYYACREFEFEPGVPHLHKKDSYGLNLMNTVAYGTLRTELGLAPFGKTPESMACVSLAGSDGKSYASHYHGGPRFIMPPYTDDLVLATYRDARQNYPAIVSNFFGCGRVILSGVHFEVNASDIQKANTDNHPGLTKIATHLENQENNRLALCRRLFAWSRAK